DRVGHRRGIDRSSALKVPERLAGGRVESDEVSLRIAAENQTARGRQHARPGRRGMLPFPLYFAGVGIDRRPRAIEGGGGLVRKIGRAIVGVAFVVRLRRGRKNVALLASRDVKKSGLRVVGRRHPVRGSGRSRTNAIPFRRGRSILGGDGSAARI